MKASACRPPVSNSTFIYCFQIKARNFAFQTDVFGEYLRSYRFTREKKKKNAHLGINDGKRLPPSFFNFCGCFVHKKGNKKQAKPDYLWYRASNGKNEKQKSEDLRLPEGSAFAGVFRYPINHPYFEESVLGCWGNYGQIVLHGPNVFIMHLTGCCCAETKGSTVPEKWHAKLTIHSIPVLPARSKSSRTPGAPSSNPSMVSHCSSIACDGRAINAAKWAISEEQSVVCLTIFTIKLGIVSP